MAKYFEEAFLNQFSVLFTSVVFDETIKYFSDNFCDSHVQSFHLSLFSFQTTNKTVTKSVSKQNKCRFN